MNVSTKGIPNLERLFANDKIPQPEGMDGIIYDAGLRHHNSSLKAILSELSAEPDKDAYEFGTLAHAINIHWPGVALKYARKDRYTAGTQSGCRLETPYSSGFANAASLIMNPARHGYEREDAQRILESNGINWSFSKKPISAQRTILVNGRPVPDPVSALELYLDRIEEGIGRDVADAEGNPQLSFDAAPNIGLSLIGFGDAVIKASEGQKMERDYLEIALRAYASSGFNETTYVQKRRLGIGDIPPAIYVMIKAGDLMKAVTPEQFTQLTSQ